MIQALIPAGRISLGVATCLSMIAASGCDWEYRHASRSRVHAVGEVRDADGRVLSNVEVRLIKHWPVEGDELIEPPPEVLFADEPRAPEGASFGVELVAVARTDAEGWFDMLLPASDIADPRFEPDAHGRIVPARTILQVRAVPGLTGQSGAYSYSFRYGRYYTHHCELFDLVRSDAQVSLATEGRVELTFARDAGPGRRRSHRVALTAPSIAAPFVQVCSQSEDGLEGCEVDPNNPDRLLVSLGTDELRDWFEGARAPLEASLTSSFETHRTYDGFPPPGDPTWRGIVDPPPPGEEPGPNPGPGPTPSPNPDPGPSPGPGPNPSPSPDPGPLPLSSVWAVGPEARVDLSGTAAVDGDPLTRHTLDSDSGLINAVYAKVDDARLVEGGLLNALVDGIDEGCLVVQITPSAYRNIETAISGRDWSGNARFCGSTGVPDEVSALKRFDTTEVDGQRAGWIRIIPQGDDDLQIRGVGEVVASGRP